MMRSSSPSALRGPRSVRVLGALAVIVAVAACGSTLAQPFQDLKTASPAPPPVTVYRLQNYEPPTAAQSGPVQLPPQIQQWLSAGAAMLPPGLLPPGLLPGGTPSPMGDPNAPRFYNFRVLGSVSAQSKKQVDEILDLFGTESNFQVPRQSCLYAEFGFQLGQGAPPGTTAAPVGGRPPAEILVSLSCEQIKLFNYNWPFGTKTGLTPDAQKRLVQLVQKMFTG